MSEEYSETIEYKGHTIKLVADSDARSPQEDSDAGLFLVANHRDFYVPEPGEKRITNDAEELVNRWKDTHWVFPLEAYIHSGVVLALSQEGNFPDRQWDVSQLGFVFAAKSEWRLSKSARKAALSLIETWNQYLSGDVWGYIVGEDSPFEDSCWGFYGKEYAIEQAKEAVDCLIRREEKEQAEANDAACRDLATVAA